MSKSPTRRQLILGGALLSAAALVPSLARAAAPVAARLSAQDHADIGRVVAYLNSIHTLESHFQQIAADGGDSSGIIYVERPGKLRLDYNPPVPVMILADGQGLYYWDKNLEQLTQSPVQDTPAWFLLRPDIKANGDITVTGFERKPGLVQLTMVETAEADLGSVTVTLSDQPLELRQWTVIDAQNRPVTVTLTDPRFNMPISEREFYWIDPRTSLHNFAR
ncbi:MAG TPA: outer membrane lipoprotein carrier protein LolA [Stellaceae bacterium]|nr:outer membrane lipoprotein carrier protein LolA [Stellaceae bacterium]